MVEVGTDTSTPGMYGLHVDVGEEPDEDLLVPDGAEAEVVQPRRLFAQGDRPLWNDPASGGRRPHGPVPDDDPASRATRASQNPHNVRTPPTEDGAQVSSAARSSEHTLM